jgi:hypothetical protein
MLTLLYTANLRGDLALLPRLYTLLRTLRTEAAGGRVLTLDAGGSCAPDVWHCAATGGRSTLIVLDAMGYDAANVAALDADARAKLADTVRLALADGEYRWQGDEGADLRVLFSPDGATTQLEGDTLTLAAVNGGAVGTARLVWKGGAAHLDSHSVHPLPAGALPDPTIAATVEFVLAEARRYGARGREA